MQNANVLFANSFVVKFSFKKKQYTVVDANTEIHFSRSNYLLSVFCVYPAMLAPSMDPGDKRSVGGME